jgi:ferredoxin
MPDIEYKREKIYCKPGENLRKVLLKHNLSPYNGLSELINCRGLGSCGTCAVKIKGIVNRKTWMEKWRLRFPPHKEKNGHRLACQVRVWSDLEIIKEEGFWGHRVRQEHHKINQSQNQSRTID